MSRPESARDQLAILRLGVRDSRFQVGGQVGDHQAGPFTGFLTLSQAPPVLGHSARSCRQLGSTLSACSPEKEDRGYEAL